MTGQSCEVGEIKREQMGHAVNMANGDKSGVVNLLFQHACCGDQLFPRVKDIRIVGQKRESRLENSRLRFRIGARQAKAVHSPRDLPLTSVPGVMRVQG